MPAPRTAPSLLWIPAYAGGAALLLGAGGFFAFSIFIAENLSDAKEIFFFALSVIALTGFSFCAARLVRPRARLVSVPQVAKGLLAALMLSTASGISLLFAIAPGTDTEELAGVAGAAPCLVGAVAAFAVIGLSRRS